MLIHKNAFHVPSAIETKRAKDSGSTVGGVRLESDGSAVVTDGHTLYKYTGQEPSEELRGQGTGEFIDCTIPFDCARKAAALFGKSGDGVELEEHSFARIESGEARAVTINVTAPGSTGACEIPIWQPSFHKYQELAEKAAARTDTSHISVSVDKMYRLFSTLKKQGFSSARIDVSEYDEEPVVVTAESLGHRVFAMVMPLTDSDPDAEPKTREIDAPQ